MTEIPAPSDPVAAARGGGQRSRLFRMPDGTGFALAMMSTWFIAYVTLYALAQLPNASALTTMHRAAIFAAWVLVDTLPMVPMFVMITNRTHAADARRYLWLLVAMTAMWVYWASLDWISGDTTGLVLFRINNLPCAFEAVLVFAAVAYRSSARSATNELLQRQIASIALDGDVKRARLRLLRAQIEPHFLFNTLATVRTLLRLDRSAAVEMIDNLMRYLSEALPKLRQDESSLAEELQLVAAYLRIHQIRMGARLSYELSIPERLGTERIPTMLLLTLVENALKHGINPTVEGGLISVSATREHYALVLKVADTGLGLTVTEGHGMGLANIRRRLSMLYGDEAIFSLARNAAHGMVATVKIPMVDAL
jgi:two-component sensor histidine kinase